MARFHGAVGYNLGTQETAPGVHEEVIVEHEYYGDLLRVSRGLQESPERLNDDITVGNSISIVADAYANDHFFNMRYVHWAGTRWKVVDVEVQRPRLILRLGGVYNGSSPAPATAPDAS